MSRKRIIEGPIGNGWVEEVRRDNGIRYIARWQRYVADPAAPDGRRRESGYYEIGPKAHHGPGLRSNADAKLEWLKVRDAVMGKTETLPAALKARKTFRWFALDDPDGFRKRRESRWGGSTPKWFDYIMSKVLPRFGDTPLAEVREQDMQAFINELADKGFSRCVVKNCRLYLRAIMSEAQKCGVIAVDPAARLVIPRNTRKPHRPFLPIEKFQAILAATSNQRDRLMMRLLYVGGVRRGELFGLQWRDWNGTDTLNLQRQILENLTVGPLKTDGSTAPYAVPVEIAADLNQWRKWCPNSAPDGWIFSSARKSHINPGKWRRDVLVPAGEAVGIVNLNYIMFRRGFATEAHEQGIGDKSIQAQMRHASSNTTREIYMQPIQSATRAAMERFDRVVEIDKKRASGKRRAARPPRSKE